MLYVLQNTWVKFLRQQENWKDSSKIWEILRQLQKISEFFGGEAMHIYEFIVSGRYVATLEINDENYEMRRSDRSRLSLAETVN